MSIVSSRMNRPTTAPRTASSSEASQELALDRWIAGGLAGGVAGLLFSVVVPPADMMPMVAILYGADGVVWGWVFHLLHSVAFGAAFAVLVSVPGLVPASLSPRLGAVVGAVYGVAIWVVFATYVMPTWIAAVTDMDPRTGTGSASSPTSSTALQSAPSYPCGPRPSTSRAGSPRRSRTIGPRCAGRAAPCPRRVIATAKIRLGTFRLESQIDGSGDWPKSRRDELAGRLRTTPALWRLVRRLADGRFRIDRAAIAAGAKLDGKGLLRTSDDTLTATDLAVAYKQLSPSSGADGT